MNSATGKTEITKNKIINDLKNIGLNKGDHVAVALSFKSIGYVVGGPDTLIEALLETVGPEGTIMMNTFTPSFLMGQRAHDLSASYVFDSAKTMPYTGLVPKTLVMRKDSIRSRHPTCSVTAIGKMAKYLTEHHDETSNLYLPYEKLAELGGKYLAIGIGDRLVAIRHEAQRRAGLFVIPLYQAVKFKNQKGQIKLFRDLIPPCHKKLPELVPKLEDLGIIRRGKIGLADSIMGSAKEIIEAMASILKENPTLNLCDDIFCYRCRELERRLNLYNRINNPKLFQKNTLIRHVLCWRNSFWIRRLNYYDWTKKPNRRTRLVQKLLDIWFHYQQFLARLIS